MDTNTSRPAPARPLVIGFVVLLLFALWQLTRSWDASILDRHEFRQLQTATSAYWLRTDGFRLDYETPLFGPPWSIPMEFPVYQWCVAALSRSCSLQLEQTGRGVGIFFFFATLPAIYGLAGLAGLAPSRRLLVVAMVLCSPTYLFYGRSFMIETTALCFASWFLYLVTGAVRDQSWRFTLGAILCAVLAGLAKVTTFAAFLFPAALLTWFFWRLHWSNRSQNPSALRRVTLYAIAPVLLSVAISYWWVRYSDHLKNINPFAGFLKSSELKEWTWGTWAQRTSGDVWSENWRNLSQFVLGTAPLAVLLFCFALVEPFYRRAAAWGAVFFLCGPLLFINLYYRHDYYYCANAVFLLGGAGFLLAGIWDSSRLPLSAKYLALLLVLGGQLGIFYSGYGANHGQKPPAPPALASVVRELVLPEDVVIIYGWDWNTLLPYYSQRRVVMVPYGRRDDFKALDDIIASLAPFRVSAMIIRNNDALRATPEWIRQRLAHFKIDNTPLATSAEGDLYLAQEDTPSAVIRLRNRSFEGVTLHTTTPVDPNEDKLVENDLAPLGVPIFQPSPTRARSMFGFGPAEHEGRPIVQAHPDSLLYFQPPPAATQIEATVGILAGAYATGNPSPTDGVTVEIVEVRPDGLRRLLYRRDLDPVHEPADRGPQSINLVEAGPFTGPIIFRITPGPKNNINSDWAYWSRIEIR